MWELGIVGKHRLGTCQKADQVLDLYAALTGGSVPVVAAIKSARFEYSNFRRDHAGRSISQTWRAALCEAVFLDDPAAVAASSRPRRTSTMNVRAWPGPFSPTS